MVSPFSSEFLSLRPFLLVLHVFLALPPSVGQTLLQRRPALFLREENMSEECLSHMGGEICRTDPLWLCFNFIAEWVIIIVYTDVIPEALQKSTAFLDVFMRFPAVEYLGESVKFDPIAFYTYYLPQGSLPTRTRVKDLLFP